VTCQRDGPCGGTLECRPFAAPRMDSQSPKTMTQGLRSSGEPPRKKRGHNAHQHRRVSIRMMISNCSNFPPSWRDGRLHCQPLMHPGQCPQEQLRKLHVSLCMREGAKVCQEKLDKSKPVQKNRTRLAPFSLPCEVMALRQPFLAICL
jgi:hypothetical protein